MGTQFSVAVPSRADWYWSVVFVSHGETDYVDGYASGDRPTLADVQEYMRCRHEWVAGMCYVADEDAESVAAVRPLSCEKCDRPYSLRDALPLPNVVEFNAEATPHGRHAGEAA